MEAIANVVLPVFGIVACGYLAGRLGLLDDASSEALNKFVYYCALPPLFFIAMARAPLEQILNWPFIAAYLGAQLIAGALSVIVGRILFGNRDSESVLHGLTAIFANTGYMGIPLFIAAFGEELAVVAILGTVLQSAIVLTAGIVFIEAGRAQRSGMLGSVGGVVRSLAINPLLVAPVLGIAASVAGLDLARPVEVFCDMLGAAAAPGALFALGLFMVGKPLTADLPEVAWLTVVKLVVHPVAAWGLAFFVFPVEPFWAASCVLLSALPSGALVFVLAQEYGIYVRRASAAILISTVVSILPVFFLFVRFADAVAKHP